MKKWSGPVVFLVAGLFSSLCLSQTSSAETPACLLKLEWQSSSDPTVVGYALYYGVNGGPLTNRVDAGPATAIVLNSLMAPDSYSFYVVAYDEDSAESDPSNFLLYTAQAISSFKLSSLPNGGMTLSFNVAPGAACHVEYTDTLTPANWRMLTATTGDSNGVVSVVENGTAPSGSRFYRAVVP
jgi:hypothetical protein